MIEFKSKELIPEDYWERE